MVMAIHMIVMKQRGDLGRKEAIRPMMTCRQETKVSKGRVFFFFFFTKRSFVVKKRGVVTKLGVSRRMEIKDIGGWS